MLCMKGADAGIVAGDQGRRDELRKLGDRQLFVMAADRFVVIDAAQNPDTVLAAALKALK